LELVEDAVKRPLVRGEDVARLAFLRGELADMLESSGDRDGAIREAEAAIPAWRQAVSLDRVNYRHETKLAEAMLALAQLVKATSAERALALDTEAAGVLAKLSARVPQPGRRLVLAPWSRALSRAGDAALDLGRIDDAVRHHRKSLEIATELAKIEPEDVDIQLDLGREHARLARALERGKRYAEAREQCAKARLLFTTHRAAADDPASVDRMIAFVDRLLATIAEGEGAAQTVSEDRG
jgi:tetratricopeptide (TPR) repeat protein